MGGFLQAQVRNDKGVRKRRKCGNLPPHPSSFLQVVVRLYHRHVIACNLCIRIGGNGVQGKRE